MSKAEYEKKVKELIALFDYFEDQLEFSYSGENDEAYEEVVDELNHTYYRVLGLFEGVDYYVNEKIKLNQVLTLAGIKE